MFLPSQIGFINYGIYGIAIVFAPAGNKLRREVK
jgi:hypothetical protein